IAIGREAATRPTRMTRRGLRTAGAACACITLLAATHARAGEILPSVRSRTHHMRAERPDSVPSDATLEAAGARIGKVIVDARNIFDTNTEQEDTVLFRLANRLHVRT